jgi:hypothetical protein
MKIIIKLVSLILVCFMLLPLLVSCGIDLSDGKDHVKGFFAAISDEDFEKAEEFLHPKMELEVELKTLFEGMENTWDVELENGITVEKFTGFKTTVHSTEVDGSILTLSMNLTIDSKSTTADVTMVENDDGFGIYSINIIPAD